MLTTTLKVTIRHEDTAEFYALIAPLLARVAEPDPEPQTRTASPGWREAAEEIFNRPGKTFAAGDYRKALEARGYEIPRSSFTRWLKKAVKDQRLRMEGEGFSARYVILDRSENQV